MTAPIQYRMATERDIPNMSKQLAASYRAAYQGMMTEDYLSSLGDDHWVPILANTFATGGTCIIAEAGGGILGSACFGPTGMEGFDGYAELYAIYLLPGSIGQGIGLALYDHAEKEMIRQGYAGCVLEVLSENERAIRFYQRHSYRALSEFTVEENDMSLRCLPMQKKWT